jgi:hypothetical protein
VQRGEARYRSDFFLCHEWRRLIPRKALAPLLHQIPRGAHLAGNLLIGQAVLGQENTRGARDELVGRFPRPDQCLEPLLFGVA